MVRMVTVKIKWYIRIINFNYFIIICEFFSTAIWWSCFHRYGMSIKFISQALCDILSHEGPHFWTLRPALFWTAACLIPVSCSLVDPPGDCDLYPLGMSCLCQREVEGFADFQRWICTAIVLLNLILLTGNSVEAVAVEDWKCLLKNMWCQAGYQLMGCIKRDPPSTPRCQGLSMKLMTILSHQWLSLQLILMNIMNGCHHELSREIIAIECHW